MTSISASSYYNSPPRYAGAEKSNANSSNFEQIHSSVKSSGWDAFKGRANEEIPLSYWGIPESSLLDLREKLANGSMTYPSKLNPWDIVTVSEEQYKMLMEASKSIVESLKEQLEMQYTTREEPDISNYPGTKPYAEVIIGGTVIATLYNEGYAGYENQFHHQISGIMSAMKRDSSGPDNAQTLAELIAERFGGRVRIAETAITQREFDALPPIPEAKITVDYEGMKADPLNAQIRSIMEWHAQVEQRRAEYLRISAK